LDKYGGTIKIESEKAIAYGFADLHVVFDSFQLLIELKYYRTPFIRDLYQELPILNRERRAALTNTGNNIFKMKEDDLLNIVICEKFESGGNVTFKSIQEQIKLATNQLQNDYISKLDAVTPLYGMVIVGVSKNFVLRAIDPSTSLNNDNVNSDILKFENDSYSDTIPRVNKSKNVCDMSTISNSSIKRDQLEKSIEIGLNYCLFIDRTNPNNTKCGVPSGKYKFCASHKQKMNELSKTKREKK